MNLIHPSAVIGPKVQLGEDNEIGPGCVIQDGAILGSHNTLWMNVYVGPGTTIGDGNQIHMGAVIGHLPQDVAFSGAPSFATIGHRNIIREYVTIHRGTQEGSSTVLGDENFLMVSAHLGHNAQVGSRTTFANLATLGGYCTVEDEAVLSGMVVAHQFTRVGRLAMVGGLSKVVKDVPPYMLCMGERAAVYGLNVVGLRRAGFSPEIRKEIKRAYRLLYREGLNIPHALEAIERECTSSEVKALVVFVRSSKRGICAKASDTKQADEAAEGPQEEEPVRPRDR